MDVSDARNWVFVLLAVFMTGTGLLTVITRNIVHAALFLVATLAGSAALFLLLGAEFVAWTIVLVYIGAVVVLFLFGVMITRAPIGRQGALDHPRPVKLVAALVALATFAVMTWAAVAFFGDDELVADAPVTTQEIGETLFDRFVVPFEAVSFVLLAALIGGIVLARRDPEA